MTLAECQARDAQDSLAFARARFELPEGVIYLDGNSLGPLPKSVAPRMAKAINEEWRTGLIRSWNDAAWYPMPYTCGAKIAKLIGAEAEEVIVCDSTSVNLYKLMHVALNLRGGRNIIITDAENFPTDTHIVESVAHAHGCDVWRVHANDLEAEICAAGTRLAVVQLTHVNFKSGARYDMAAITALTQKQGAKIIWDLAHSAGAMEVQLNTCGADFAVGCGYKYLNGGPGAPAFAFVAKRHHATIAQPLKGWHGHAKPFDFSQDYTAAEGVKSLLCGTAPQLSLIALDAALDAFDGVDFKSLREKSKALTSFFVDLVETHCAGKGCTLASPRNPELRGSQVSFAHPEAYAIMQALIDRNVIGDFRAPDLVRFGFAPLYLGFADVFRAVQELAAVMQSGAWNHEKYLRRKLVT